MNLWQIEDALEYNLICGCDEAGAGPLAGPVYGAAVILPKGIELEGLNDSKKISEKKRDLLYDKIIENCISYAIASISAKEIDEINILNARMKAMREAVLNLSQTPDFVLIDGNCDRGFEMDCMMVIGGDGKSANIAAASILAKVERDRYMKNLDKTYPEFGFAKHKGYGTKAHVEAILTHGECPEHRQTFLRKIYGRNK